MSIEWHVHVHGSLWSTDHKSKVCQTDTLGEPCALKQCSTQGVQLSRTQKANSVFPGNVTTATATQPDLGHLLKQSGTSPLDYIIPLHQLRMKVMARYPNYQVYSEEPAPTKPTLLGMANYQQAQIAKHANLPLSLSLRA